MLDEMIEYRQYTAPLDRMDIKERLKYYNLQNGLAGIERAMIIVARKFFFEDFKNDPEKWEKTKEVLSLWFGKCIGEESPRYKDLYKEYDWIRNWFPRYISFRLIKASYTSAKDGDVDSLSDWYGKTEIQIEKQIDDFLTKYSEISKKDKNVEILRTANKRKQLLLPVKKFSLLEPENIYSYDLNSYSYDTVIAEAAERGPLKQYCLAVKEDFPVKENIMKNGKTNKSNVDITLKLTALILKDSLRMDCVKRKNEEGEEYTRKAAVNLAALGNWSKFAGRIKTGEKLEPLIYKGQPLFDIDSVGNTKKIGVFTRWIDDHGFEVIEVKDIQKYKDKNMNAVFYYDVGASDDLKKSEFAFEPAPSTNEIDEYCKKLEQ